MEEESILEQVGLNRKEAKIYLILLSRGEYSAVDLSKEVGLHRRTVYDTLDSLQQKGLISVKIKKYVKHYFPANPEALLDSLKQKQVLIKAILPTLNEKFELNKAKTRISIFEGKEGLKNIFDAAFKESKKTGGEVVVIGAGLRTPKYIKYSITHYVKKFSKIKWKLIEPDFPGIRESLREMGVDLRKICRFLPAKYLTPVGILTYSDKTVIMLLEEEIMLIQITGKNYAKAFKNYFKLLWKVAKS